ncbi:MAG: cytochrome C [Myxococcota bacterium]
MSPTFLHNLLKPDNIAALLLLPIFLGVFLWWWRQAARNDARIESGGLEALADTMRGPVPPAQRALGFDDRERVHTWPYLLRVELVVSLACMTILTVWSICIDAPLEQEADPNRTPNPSKAPWYFVGLQEMLVYFDPWIAGVVLPLLIIVGLAAIPYLDPNPEGSGYYCWKSRRIALSLFWLGFALWLVLIVVGTFFRGPGWNWFWPWETWDPHRHGIGARRDWVDLFGMTDPWLRFIGGGLTILSYYALGGLLWWRLRKTPEGRAMGRGRFFVAAFLALTMGGLVLKMMLRLGLGVQYVWVTPWFSL